MTIQAEALQEAVSGVTEGMEGAEEVTEVRLRVGLTVAGTAEGIEVALGVGMEVIVGVMATEGATGDSSFFSNHGLAIPSFSPFFIFLAVFLQVRRRST